MSTRWTPAPYKERPTWLATDGTQLECPVIETTPSQRRWRVSGTTDSVARHDLSSAIKRYMQGEAARQRKTLWLEVDNPDTDVELHRQGSGNGYGGIDFDEPPTLNLTERGTTPIGFQFTARDYPHLTAMLWVSWSVGYNQQTTISTCVSYRPTAPYEGAHHTHRRYFQDASVTIPEISWELTNKAFGANPRAASEYFAELLRWAADVDTLTLPDERSAYEGGTGTIVYEFTRSNYTTDVYRQALDLVQAGPSMERLNQLLRQVRDELRNLGIVANLRDGFDTKALLNGRLSELQLQVWPQEDAEETSPDGREFGLDPHHKVLMDLANGTFAVSCSRQHLEDVAAGWEVAKFKAEIGGDTDVLMAYAEAFNLKGQQDRLRKIITQRAPRTPRKPRKA